MGLPELEGPIEIGNFIGGEGGEWKVEDGKIVVTFHWDLNKKDSRFEGTGSANTLEEATKIAIEDAHNKMMTAIDKKWGKKK